MAVLSVMISHCVAWPAEDYLYWWAPGPTGVRLFFVLSGFLITGILVHAKAKAEEDGSPRRQILKAFYIRRGLRILPLAFAVLALVWYWQLTPMASSEKWWFLTYTSNIEMARRNHFNPVLGHFWSLAIEEQFYWIWPLVLLAIPNRWVRPALVGCAALSIVGRMVVWQHAPFAAFVLTPTRIDAFALGGLAATWDAGQVRYRFLAAIGVLLLLLAQGYELPAMCGETGMVLLSVVLVHWVATHTSGLARILSWKPCVWLGTISYGVYILHPFSSAFFPEPGVSRFMGMMLTVVPLAAFSWVFFERPINLQKDRWPYVGAPTAVRTIATAAGHRPIHLTIGQAIGRAHLW